MLARLIRFVILRLVRLFYPRIEVQGRELLPSSGPVIFVLNHPNGLLDPLLLMASLQRPVAFLAKSTFFAQPLGRICMKAFGALPVFRQQDAGQPGAASGDAAARNEQTFARCRALLAQETALALFPEGTTHSGATMLPLRTGAARIALSAEAEHDWQLGVQIVPVGLWYQHKTLFRSATLLVIGQPFGLAPYAAQYTLAERETVQALTTRLDEALDAVVLQAEHNEVLSAMPVIAAWTAPNGPPLSLREQRARAATLLAAYKQLSLTDPARLHALTHQARRYARLLRLLGIDDPWALELSQVRWGGLVSLLVLLLVGFPFAAAGFALSYGPYRLAGRLTPPLVGRHDTLLGTGKLIVGSALVLLGWLLAAIIVGVLASPLWGAALLLVAPGLAYIALRWGEGRAELRAALTYGWIRSRHTGLAQALAERRRAFAAAVVAALQDTTLAVPDDLQYQRSIPADPTLARRQ